MVTFCRICGLPWTDAKKANRCHCDISGAGEQKLVEIEK